MFFFESIISNNGINPTSLRVDSNSLSRSTVVIRGEGSNVHTGATIMSGRIDLFLNKNGVAVSGSVLNLEKGASVHFLASNQIGKRTEVILMSGSLLIKGASNVQYISHLNWYNKDNYVSGSVIEFDNTLGGIKYLYVDVLTRNLGSKSDLYVNNWQEDVDFFLLRKTDSNAQALGNVRVNGHYAMLKDYNEEYWQVGVFLPEPGTYGAVLGALGLGVFMFRKARRKSAPDQVIP